MISKVHCGPTRFLTRWISKPLNNDVKLLEAQKKSGLRMVHLRANNQMFDLILRKTSLKRGSSSVGEDFGLKEY